MTAAHGHDEAEWLISEMRDYLGAGRVGLYEFMWALRSEYPDLDVRTMRTLCRAALDSLLDEQDVRLVFVRWADDTGWSEPASPDRVNDTSWDDIGDDPYLALVRSRG